MDDEINNSNTNNTESPCEQLLRYETFIHEDSRQSSDDEYGEDDVTVIEELNGSFRDEHLQLYQPDDDSLRSNSGSDVLIINLEDPPSLPPPPSPPPSYSTNMINDVSGINETNDIGSDVSNSYQMDGGAKEFPLQEENTSSGESALSPFAETFGSSLHSWRPQAPLPPSLQCPSFQEFDQPCLTTSAWWPPETPTLLTNTDPMLRAVHDEARNADNVCCGHAFDHSRAFTGYNGGFHQDAVSPYFYPNWSNINSSAYLPSFDEQYHYEKQYPFGSAAHPVRNWQFSQHNCASELPRYSDGMHINAVSREGPTSCWTDSNEQCQSDSATTENMHLRPGSLHTPPPLLAIGSPPRVLSKVGLSPEIDVGSSATKHMLCLEEKNYCSMNKSISNSNTEPIDWRLVGSSVQSPSAKEGLLPISVPVTSSVCATSTPSVSTAQNPTIHVTNKLMTYYMMYPVNGINSLQPRLLTPSFQQPIQATRAQPPRYVTVREMLAERSKFQKDVKSTRTVLSPQNINPSCSPNTTSVATTFTTTQTFTPSSQYMPTLSLSEQFPITSALLTKPRMSTVSPAVNNIGLYPLNPPIQLTSVTESAPQTCPEAFNMPLNIISNSSSQLLVSSHPDILSNSIHLPQDKKQMKKTLESDKTFSDVTSTDQQLPWKEQRVLRRQRSLRVSIPKPLHFDVQHLFIGKFKVEVYATKHLKLLNRLKVLFSKRLFVYEFDIPDKVGDLGYTQSKVAAIEFPFSSVEALHCDSRLVQIKVKHPPEMHLGSRRLQRKTGGGNIQYDKTEKVDLTGGELARYPLHELLLRKTEANRLRTSLEEFDSSFKKKIRDVITVECQDPEPESLTHMMIEQPTLESDSAQQWKRFCLDLEQRIDHRSELEQSLSSIQ